MDIDGTHQQAWKINVDHARSFLIIVSLDIEEIEGVHNRGLCLRETRPATLPATSAGKKQGGIVVSDD